MESVVDCGGVGRWIAAACLRRRRRAGSRRRMLTSARTRTSGEGAGTRGATRGAYHRLSGDILCGSVSRCMGIRCLDVIVELDGLCEYGHEAYGGMGLAVAVGRCRPGLWPWPYAP